MQQAALDVATGAVYSGINKMTDKINEDPKNDDKYYSGPSQ